MATGKVTALLALPALLSACATQPAPTATEVTYDGLVPVRDTNLEFAWVKPDMPLSAFDQVMLERPELQFRAVRPISGTVSQVQSRTEFPISEDSRQKLADIVDEKFREELAQSTHYRLTAQPGPSVLVLKPSLLDIVSHVPPEPVGRSDIYLDSVGEATLVVEIVDSVSGETLARAADRRAAEPPGTMGTFGALYSSPVTTWQEVRRLADRWARLLGQRVDQLYFASKPK
jgi:hypothetical protein